MILSNVHIQLKVQTSADVPLSFSVFVGANMAVDGLVFYLTVQS